MIAGCVEVGVFTGYSALATALALPKGGKIVACDVSEEFTAKAREHWERAGVTDKIELRLAPALETMRAIKAGAYDFGESPLTSVTGRLELALAWLPPATGRELWRSSAYLQPTF